MILFPYRTIEVKMASGSDVEVTVLEGNIRSVKYSAPESGKSGSSNQTGGKGRTLLSKRIDHNSSHCYYVELLRGTNNDRQVKLSELYVGGRTSYCLEETEAAELTTKLGRLLARHTTKQGGDIVERMEGKSGRFTIRLVSTRRRKCIHITCFNARLGKRERLTLNLQIVAPLLRELNTFINHLSENKEKELPALCTSTVQTGLGEIEFLVQRGNVTLLSKEGNGSGDSQVEIPAKDANVFLVAFREAVAEAMLSDL